MGIKINNDIGVQADNLMDFVSDPANSKFGKNIVKEVLEQIEKPDFKAVLLSRNTSSYPHSFFMLTRNIVDTVKLRFYVPSKLHKLSDSTKLLALATLPFAVLGLTDRTKFLFSSEPKTRAKIYDTSFEITAEAGNVCEGVGLLMEASAIVIDNATKLSPLASALGVASTFFGLANIAIDVRGIFKTTNKVGKISPHYKLIKNALIERFSYKNLSHALSILSTTVTFVAFSLVFFGSSTFLLASSIVMGTGLALGFGRMVLDSVADQIIKERIYVILKGQAAAAA